MKNQYKIDKKLVNSWAKEFQIIGASAVIALILCIVIGVLGTALLILSIYASDFFRGALAVLLIIYAIYRLFFYRYVVFSKRYKVLCNLYGTNEWLRTTEFLDDRIILTEHNATNTVYYENIKKIKENDSYILIILKDNLSIRLYKDAFIDCSWEDCKSLILSKQNNK